jgi:hypothetical protein
MPCCTGAAEDTAVALDDGTDALASGPTPTSFFAHEPHAGREPTTESTMMG